VKKSSKTISVGGKIVAALLMIVLFTVLVPTRGAEVARSNDQLQTCQDHAGTVALVEQSFNLEISRPVIYLAFPEEGLRLQSPAIPIHPNRGPPVFS